MSDLVGTQIVGFVMHRLKFCGHYSFSVDSEKIFEPVRDKTNNLGFPPGPTQTGLYSHRSRLET